MKKVKTIKQLAAEKKHLLQRQAELERAIKYDWLDLKTSLTPGSVAQKLFEKKKGDDSIAAVTLSKLAGGLAKKMTIRLESKLAEWLKK